MTIDSNIPIPEKQKKSKYPLLDMNVGESFLSNNSYNAIQSACSRVKKDTGMKFMTRKDEGGIRVWRIK